MVQARPNLLDTSCMSGKQDSILIREQMETKLLLLSCRSYRLFVVAMEALAEH